MAKGRVDGGDTVNRWKELISGHYPQYNAKMNITITYWDDLTPAK